MTTPTEQGYLTGLYGLFGIVEDRSLAKCQEWVDDTGNHSPLPVAFSFEDPEHVVPTELTQTSPPTMWSLGHLFEGETDFGITEAEITEETSNISQYSFRNVYGSVSCYFCTKNDQLDSLNWQQAETIARWFAHTNMTNVVFRGLILGQKIRHRGFRVYPIDVPFEFRLKPDK